MMDIFARSTIDDYITDDVLLLQAPDDFSCGAAPTLPTCAVPTCSAPTFPDVTLPSLPAAPTLALPTWPTTVTSESLASLSSSPRTASLADDNRSTTSSSGASTPVRSGNARDTTEWIETYGNGCGSQLHVYADIVEVSCSPWIMDDSINPLGRRWGFGGRGKKNQDEPLIP